MLYLTVGDFKNRISWFLPPSKQYIGADLGLVTV